MSDVRELDTLEPKLGAAITIARSWLQIDDDWALVVAEVEARILPVDTVERDEDW